MSEYASCQYNIYGKLYRYAKLFACTYATLSAIQLFQKCSCINILGCLASIVVGSEPFGRCSSLEVNPEKQQNCVALLQMLG